MSEEILTMHVVYLFLPGGYDDAGVCMHQNFRIVRSCSSGIVLGKCFEEAVKEVGKDV